MPKHQRLALPWVLAAAVLASVSVAAVPSSGANPAPKAFKRQDRDSNNALPSLLPSLFPNFSDVDRSSSLGLGAGTTTSITTTTTSPTADTTSSSSTRSTTTTSARFNPAPIPSTSTSSSTITTTRAALTTIVPTTSRPSPLSPSTSTSTSTTSTAIQRTTRANTDLVVSSLTGVATVFFTPTFAPTVSQSASVVDNPTTPEESDSSDKGFMGNKGAVGATFTVVGLVSAGLVVCAVLFIRKRMRDRDLHDADWGDASDSASMADFASASAHVAGGTGGTTILPSAALAHQPSNRGHEVEQDHPDSVLAMPPVMNNDRPRDSAYNIVPAAPPQPPLRTPRDHTSFGSMMGADPFAGGPPTMWQAAERDSAHGAGQAGRGAGANALGNHNGYSMQPYSGGARATPGGDGGAYGGAPYSGGQQASGYQYAYPSHHAYGQQYPSNPQQGSYGYGY